MKKLFLLLMLIPIGLIGFGQDSYPINDLPGATVATGATLPTYPGTRDFTPTNCNDLTQPISIVLGVPSPNPGSPERVGTQDGRIFRDAVPSVCPSKPYPGLYSQGYTFGYHAIQFSNCSPKPVCITVTVNLDGGGGPCGTNAHALVYQSYDGQDATPYDPVNQSVNYLGDLGSSVSQPFEVEVKPGYFEVVFTNTFTVSQCDVSFSITVPEGSEGAINCGCGEIPISNYALIIGILAIAVFTVARLRKS